MRGRAYNKSRAMISTENARQSVRQPGHHAPIDPVKAKIVSVAELEGIREGGEILPCFQLAIGVLGNPGDASKLLRLGIAQGYACRFEALADGALRGVFWHLAGPYARKRRWRQPSRAAGLTRITRSDSTATDETLRRGFVNGANKCYVSGYDAPYGCWEGLYTCRSLTARYS